MQRLESQPDIEVVNINRGFDGMREADFDEARFDAWVQGKTGYPLIDACMRALHQTGWLNFRMRAMVVSFSSYHLWLHWQRPALHLAREFLDYEPGIHYSQIQMQSGVTGINTIRIYSPIKQAIEQDPAGKFIRQYLPELRDVPDAYIHQPHLMTTALQDRLGCQIGLHYPAPVVDHAVAYRRAKDEVHAWRRHPEVRARAEKVFQQHGSRKKRHRRPRKVKKADPRQGSLF